MNVSSVKNINGETFSAVQDAALTDVVQTNSGNWQDITAYQNASAGYLTAVDLSPYQTTAGMVNYYTTADANTMSGMLSGAIDYVSANAGDEFPASANEAITAYQNASGTYLTAIDIPESATWNDTSDVVQTNSGSWSFIPTYEYTDNDLISAIDTSGLYAASALESRSTNILNNNGEIGAGAYYADKSQANHSVMMLNPTVTPFAVTSGIYGPLQYAAGAVTTYGSSSYNTQYFGGFLKGNEWYISNATAGQALIGETHKSRGVHLSGSFEDGRCFDLSISGVSGKNNTADNYNWKLERGCVSGKGSQGEWRYGPAEDTALRTVSALEYNAVDEISGIAGSAIAQYGAEKQWLVHDDTLVHAANSAQYALGVNLSAVAQLLGIDETILWSGNAGFGEMPITLSESMDNFENIEFTWIPRYNGDYGCPTRVDKLSTNAYNGKLQWTLGGFYNNAGANWIGYVCLSANNTSTVLTHASSFFINPAATAGFISGTNLAFRVCKVVGIGRKA